MLLNLPVARPAPNCSEFIDIVTGRQSVSNRVPLVEYIVDDALLEPISTQLLGRTWVPW